ncbi:MAG TPA: dynamin family protein [Acidimicrobiia bacterium]|nr:dynamin family protein [Acidimicrobiia bacterium]
MLAQGLEACKVWNRSDLAAKLRLAQARLARPATLVCVVGEYKQGKSTLINALVGSPVCPVHDDLATSVITAVYGTKAPAAQVRRVVDGRPQVEEVPIEALHLYVSEQGNPAERAGIELVEVGIPSPALEDGFTLVDTPGIGGFLEEHTAATLRFLGLADAVVFVTDASQELTASEVAFLQQARQVCPHLLVTITKIDLYPEWRRIVERDRAHLAARRIDVDVFTVASVLQMEALSRRDDGLADESGVPALLAELRGRILDGAKQRSARRAIDELRWALERLLQPVESEMAILQNPGAADQMLSELRATQERLERLREAGARWSTVLTDGFTDLRSEVELGLRTAVRALLADVDALLEQVDPAPEWDNLAGEVRQRLSLIASDRLTVVEEGATAIRDRIIALLADEEQACPDLVGGDAVDVATVWAASRRGLKEGRGRGIVGVLSSGVTALRGGASGIYLLGVAASLAGFALAGPVSLGVAAVFGGKQILDTRKAALKQRRQEARMILRQFIDEVTGEVGNRARQLVQDLHRLLRDHYSARLQELSRSTAAALQATQEALARDRAGREQRADVLGKWAEQLRRQLAELPAPGPTGASR